MEKNAIPKEKGTEALAYNRYTSEFWIIYRLGKKHIFYMYFLRAYQVPRKTKMVKM